MMKTPNAFLLLLGLLFGFQRNQGHGQELFVFEANEGLFTAGAFINAAGYDLEYNKAGMHPIRAELRAELESRLSQDYKESIRQYYATHEHFLGSYEKFALLLSKPPEFSLRYDPESCDAHIPELVNDLPGLELRLAEFHRRARIHELWKKYRPAIQARIDQHKPHAQEQSSSSSKAWAHENGTPTKVETSLRGNSFPWAKTQWCKHEKSTIRSMRPLLRCMRGAGLRWLPE